MSTIETWIAYRQARTIRLQERLAEAFKAPEDTDKSRCAMYATATETRDRLQRDMQKWERMGDERMTATCRTAIEAEERKIAELSPKADPFVVAISLLRIIAEERSG